MRLSIRFEKKPLTLADAIRKINLRNRKFGKLSNDTKFPLPWKLDLAIGGIYMKDEGWSNLHQCETPPQFWIYIEGRSEVLQIKTSSTNGVEFKKVLAVPNNKKIYRLA